MNTKHRQPSSCTRSARADDRGAILLIGLLAGVMLIGFVWMLMRVGDTLAMREQAGGAADAIAFSTAVIHSRNLNFVAMLNLLMAAILAVRVVLRGMELAVVILAFPTLGASLAALPAIIGADAATTPAIMAGLASLGATSGFVASSTPAMARGTADYIGRRYQPLVKEAIVASAGADAYGAVMGLPVQPDLVGNEECGRAASFMPDMMRKPLSYIGMGWLAKLISKPLRKVVGAGSFFFCGLGANLPVPIPGSDDLSKQAEAGCRKQVEDAHLDPLSKEGQDKFRTCMLTSGDLVNSASAAAQAVVNNAANGAIGLIPPTTMEIQDWKNGDPYWQIVAVPTLDVSSLEPNAMVSLAGFGKRSVGQLPAGSDHAVSEAEFYFDCSGKWEDGDCGGPVEPMWNLQWKARLVRSDPNSAMIKRVYDPLLNEIQSEVSQSVSGDSKDFFGSMQDFMVH